MKKILPLLLLAVVVMGAHSAQAQLGNIRLVDYKVLTVNPLTLDVNVRVTVTNDTTDLLLRRVFCLGYQFDQPFLKGCAEEVTLPRGTSTQKVKIQVDKAEGVSLIDLIESALHFDATLYKADVTVDMQWPNGRVESKSRNGIRLQGDRIVD